jgi:DNA-binding beta-propeller fold protein YncE
LQKLHFLFAGIAGSSNNQFSFPYGIALDSNSGTLYIADQTNHRVMRYFSGASTGDVVAGGNGAGTGNNQLSSPCGIYFDSSSNSLIIANFAANNIVRWPIGASSWTLIAGSVNGIGGNTATLLDRPLGVVMDSWGNVYAADTYNQRIQFFLAGQSNGTTIAGITSTLGSTANLFRYPYSLALDSQLNLYVSDTYNFRVQKFFRY